MKGRFFWVFLVGALLIFGVVVWQLFGTTFKKDVEVICNAESASGETLATNGDAVARWISGHVQTAEGNKLWADLKLKLRERGKVLRDAQTQVGLASCPMADVYDKLHEEGLYRADVHALCSELDLGDLKYQAEADRTKALEAWVTPRAKSDKTKAFVAKLLAAPPAERGSLLRKEAEAAGAVGRCALAATLEKEPIARPEPGSATITFGDANVQGDVKPDDIAAAMKTAVAPIQKCFAGAPAGEAKEGGSMQLTLKIDPGGKIAAVGAVSVTTTPDLAACVKKAIGAVELAKTNTKPSSAIVALTIHPEEAAAEEKKPGGHHH